MSLSAKEVAVQFGTDARTLRKFLRATTPKDDQPGQGNRWSVDEDELKALRKKFDEWALPKVADPADELKVEVEKLGKKKKGKVKAGPKVEEITQVVDDFDDIDIIDLDEADAEELALLADVD